MYLGSKAQKTQTVSWIPDIDIYGHITLYEPAGEYSYEPITVLF